MSRTQSANMKIREFVLGKFPLARKRGVQDGDSLLDDGIVDSLGVLDLVDFIQQEFGIHVSDEELLPENFQSILRLAAFVNSKRETTPGQPSGLKKGA